MFFLIFVLGFFILLPLKQFDVLLGSKNFYVEEPSFLNKYVHRKHSELKNTFPRRNILRNPKPEGVFRIFILGGSTAQGFPYESRQSWTGMMELALKQLGRWKDVEVVNLGFSALSSGYVADLAPKIVAYEPDFIVVYTGHNEYYGVPSEVTGGQHWRQRLGYALYEWAPFRWLRDALIAPQASDSNLMAEQFFNVEFPPEEEREVHVSQAFRENVLAASGAWKDIPHVFITPVSNLFHMPPFRSFHPEVENTVARYNGEEAFSLFAQRLQLIPNFEESPLGAFLRGVNSPEAEERWNLLIQARDNDRVPFRARSDLVDTLRQSQVPLLDIEKVWKEQGGVSLFSNLIFADHLHFNMAGQRSLAFEVLKYLAQRLGLGEDAVSSFQATLANDELLRKKLYLGFEAGLQAEGYIASLLSQSPFKDMILPYIPERTVFYLGGQVPPQEMTDWFFENLSERSFPLAWVDYYVERGKLGEAQRILKMLQFLYPGDYRFHLNRAAFLDQNGYPLCLKYYALAYLLHPDADIERRGLNASMNYFKSNQAWQKTLDYLANHDDPWDTIDDASGAWVVP